MWPRRAAARRGAGALCATCSAGFFGDKGLCRVCQSTSVEPLLAGFVVLALLVVVAVLVFRAAKRAALTNGGRLPGGPAVHAVMRALRNNSAMTAKVQIVMAFGQVSSMLYGNLSLCLAWPVAFAAPLASWALGARKHAKTRPETTP